MTDTLEEITRSSRRKPTLTTGVLRQQRSDEISFEGTQASYLYLFLGSLE